MEDALQLPLPFDLSLDKIEKEIKKLRQSLEEAGDVNLTAIEDLEKQQTRFSFIKQQMDDMQASKAELLAIIRQLDSESRTLFKETFMCRVLCSIRFMGSGTVAVVARDLNRSSVGCELNPDYVKIIKERLQSDSCLDTGTVKYEFKKV